MVADEATPAARRWWRSQRSALARAAPGGGPDAAAGRFLRAWSVVPATADRYDGHWRTFSVFCARRGVSSLPATTATVVAFIGHQWRRHAIVAISLKPMLAAIRKRHLAAGLVNPCDAEAVREAKSGFRRADLALRPQPSRAVAPLPAAVAWRLALLATYAPAALRRRLTAVVMQFWWLRRAQDLTRFTVTDVQLPADGSVSFLVRYHKTVAVDGPLARTLPPAALPHADVPRLLLARLLADRCSAAPLRGGRLFSTCRTSDSSGVMTGWLREGLTRLGVSPPLGVRYASHSLKKGGATAGFAAGVGRGTIAAFSNTSEQTLAETYISALVTPSEADRCFFGRLAVPAGPARRPYSI